MRRDFSEAAKRELLLLVSQGENEKWCDFTDFIGDRWYDFEEWIDKLDIRDYISKVNEYHKKVIDKNNSTVYDIEQIFTNVNDVSLQYKSRFAALLDDLQEYKKIITLMSTVVKPSNGRFNAEFIGNGLRNAVNTYIETSNKLQIIAGDGFAQEDIKKIDRDNLNLKRIIELYVPDIFEVLHDFSIVNCIHAWEKTFQKSTAAYSMHMNSPSTAILMEILVYLKEIHIGKNELFDKISNKDIFKVISDYTDLSEDEIKIIQKLSDLTSFIDNISEDSPKSIGFAGDILSYIGSLSKSLDSDEDIFSRYLNFCDLSGNSMTVLSGVYDFVNEKNVSSELGIAGAFCSVFTNIIKMKDYDMSEKLMECGDLLWAIGILADKGSSYILDIDTKSMSVTEKVVKRSNISAFLSLITMSGCFVGNIMHRTNDDGVYDINDYGDTLLDTGITGGSSFIKGVTFGLIDIDNDRATDIFNKNIASTTDFINKVGDSVGAPTWAKVVATIPAAGLVSAWSVGEVFVDYGMQIGNSIMKIKNNFF